MKKHAKILALGAISALSMGIFAVTNPVMAEDLLPLDYENARTSADVTVQITVEGEVPTVNIAKPLDGETFIGSVFPVNVGYTDATSLEYELIFVADDGSRVSYNLPKDIVSTQGAATGSKSFNVDITNYGGKFGNYILKAKAIGSGSAVDSVSFRLISFDFYVKGHEEETNNPIITIPKNPDFYKTLIQAFDEDGNAIFDEPIEQILDEDGDTDVTLPFAEYGVPKGTYRVVATPYNEEGEIAAPNAEHDVEYAPAEAPEVPDTGGFFGALNLSRQDLISTGLALLVICGFFGIALVMKRNKNDKRR
jgi:hypothetical protein